MTNASLERLSREPAFQAMFRLGRRRRVPRRRIVLAEGETPRTLYFVLSGSVAVRLSNWHGQEVLLAYMHAGDFFGEMGLFPDVPARSARVETASDCLLLEIGYDGFIELTREHPRLWLELAGQLAARLRATNRRLAELPTVPVADRIWSVLLELAGHAEAPPGRDGVLLRIKRADLGKLAGCSREVAGTVLQRLEAEGRITLEGHRIRVRAPAATA